MINFGVIGYGKFGKAHADSIKAVKEARLVAISARSKESCSRARNDFGVDTHQDYHELLRRKDIEAVNIVVPNYLHYQVAMDALEAGKHVLLEKPMALTVEECEKINELAGKKKTILYIGFEARLSSLWGRIKQLIDEGKVGNILTVWIELWRGAYFKGSTGWRWKTDQVGSWILEEPVHFFDLARWYYQGLGEPVSIYSQANSKVKDADMLDNFLAVINYPDRKYVTISFTLAAYEHHQTVKVIGDRGTIIAVWKGAEARARTATFSLEYFDGKEKTALKVEKKPGELFELEEEIRKFVQSITNQEEPFVSGKDGLQAVKLCLKAEESIKQGKVIPLRSTGGT